MRRILVLGALLAALVLWDRALVSSAQSARFESVRVGRLIPVADQERIKERMKALEIQAGGRTWRYLPFSGSWRCIDRFAAPADLAAMNTVVERLLAAEGVAQTSDPAKFAGYGIGSDETITVTFHGQDAARMVEGRLSFPGDALLRVEVGLAIPGRDGCYARLGGAQEVWAVDASPLDLLAPALAGQPPLLDGHLVATGWPPGHEAAGTGRAVDQFLLERGGEVLEFSVHQVEVTPEEMQRGAVPFEWTLHRNGVPTPVHSILTAYYGSFLLQAPYHELVDPSTAQGQGFGADGSAAITLVPREGQALRLEISPPRPDGSSVVLNPHTQCLYSIDAETRRLLVPPAELLDVAAANNPWDEYMRARAGR